jgi:tetratricopeptide (TPR) repeat protein
MRKYYVGKNREENLYWLLKEWPEDGSCVCFIEGEPGVGKTDLAHDFEDAAIRQGMAEQVFYYTAPDSKSPDFIDVLLEISAALSQKGLTAMEDYLFNTRKTIHGLAIEKALEHPIIIVLDEAQRLFSANSGSPIPAFMDIFLYLRNRKLKGRLLLLSDRMVDRSKRWSEWIPIRKLTELKASEAFELLESRLQEANVFAGISEEQKRDAVRVMHFNPRAIEALAGALRFSSLEEIIENNKGFWSVHDRDIDRSFLRTLEQNLLEGTMRHLELTHQRRLWRLAVHRRNFKREALDRLCESREEAEQLYSILITRFFLNYYKDSITLNPVVREIALTHLKEESNEFRQAHSAAADYHLRHFKSKQIVASEDKLSESFAESRYHLVQAGRQDELRDISHRYTDHLRQKIKSGAPVPIDRDQLEERISVLQILLEEAGAKGLEYHLAQCLKARNKPGDLVAAIKHIKRALGPRAWQSWYLLATLQSQLEGINAALNTIHRALGALDDISSTTPFYVLGAKLLSGVGRNEEAQALLTEGIGKVPPESAFPLYEYRANLLARAGKVIESIKSLRDAMQVIPPDKDLFAIYRSCATILSDSGDHGQAVEVLREGISLIPEGNNLYSLYQALSEIFCRDERVSEAIAANLEGARKLQAHKGHKLVEGAILLAAGSGNSQKLSSVISSSVCGRQQTLLGTVLALQLKGEWLQAADLARTARLEFPRYLLLTCTEALCRLAIGEVEVAWHSLNRFEGIALGKGDPHTWLATLILLHRKMTPKASETLATYLGSEIHQNEVTTGILLAFWDQQKASEEGHRLCFYFPVLPASLTGMPRSVSRVPFAKAAIDSAVIDRLNGKNTLAHTMNGADFDIYVSYGWGEDQTAEGRRREEIVDRLCERVRASGHGIGRDKDHQHGGDSIERFAQRISKAKCIVAVISEKYLRSTNCMVRELFTAFRRCDYSCDEFKQKIIALVMDDAKPFLHSEESILGVANDWKRKYEEQVRQLEVVDPSRKSHEFWEYHTSLGEMVPRIPEMLSALNDVIMRRGFEAIVQNEFAEVIDRLPHKRGHSSVIPGLTENSP